MFNLNYIYFQLKHMIAQFLTTKQSETMLSATQCKTTTQVCLTVPKYFMRGIGEQIIFSLSKTPQNNTVNLYSLIFGKENIFCG